MRDEEREALNYVQKLIEKLAKYKSIVINFECKRHPDANAFKKHSLTEYSLKVNYPLVDQPGHFSQQFYIVDYHVIDFYEKLKIFWNIFIEKEEEVNEND